MLKRININSVILDSSRKLIDCSQVSPAPIYYPDVNLWDVQADVSLLDNAIRDVAALSRSRMEPGSIYSVETQNITLNNNYCSTRADVSPGDYAELLFSDNGRGFTGDEIRMLLRKPGGRDKGVSKLSTALENCRELVALTQGALHIYSEVNGGTTYKIYLPRAAGVRNKDDMEWFNSLPKGDETILFADDDAYLSEICLAVLSQYGYRVLNTSDGEEALKIVINYPDPIHLLITDVIMPNMAGNELYKSIHEIHPETNVLFTSGYTRHVIIQQEVMSENGYFLQKPFSKAGLLWMVRSTLENPQTS